MTWALSIDTNHTKILRNNSKRQNGEKKSQNLLLTMAVTPYFVLAYYEYAFTNPVISISPELSSYK